MGIKRMVAVVVVGVSAVAASPLVAQPWRGGASDGAGSNAVLGAAFASQGEVVSFQGGLGMGTPTLVVRDGSGHETAYVLGPFRVLQAQGFAAAAGDRVEVSGWTCTSCQHGVVVGEVKNTTRGLTLVLRADGAPTWSGAAGQGIRRHLGSVPGGSGASGLGTATGQGARGAAAGGLGGRCAGGAPDLGRAATFAGTVVSFSGAPGAGLPTLAIDAAQGRVTVQISPYRALRAAGYEPAAGDKVEVTAAPAALDGQDHWVALAIKDAASGLVVTLRDPSTGAPLAGGRCPRR